MTQTYNLPTSFLDIFHQLICFSTTTTLPSQWLHCLQQFYSATELCYNLSNWICYMSRYIYKSPSTDWHPWWKQSILFRQISLHSDTNTHLQLLNWLPTTRSWVPTLRCCQDYNVTNPQWVLPQTTEPYNVLIYQATSLHFWIPHWNAYYKGKFTSIPYHLWFRQPTHHFNHQMTLSNPTLQPQFGTYSRHRLAFLSIQSLMQIPGYALTIPANSGANQALSTMLLMIQSLSPLILLTDLSKLSPQNRDPTVQ